MLYEGDMKSFCNSSFNFNVVTSLQGRFGTSALFSLLSATCTFFIKVAVYGNGHGQRSKQNNSHCLRVRLQLQNTEDESRGTTQTCTTKSYEKSLRSSCAGVVKVGEFSSQILLLQTTRRDEPQCRGTILNIFEVRTKAFSKSTSHFLRNSLFLLKVHVPHNYYCFYTCDS